MFDIAVAGGGPAGSIAAALLARDHDTVVFEEHSEIGVPVQCAGLISDDAIRLSGVSPDIIATIHGAEAIFPDGSSVTICSDKPKARVVDRTDLDSRLADRAMAAGAEYVTGSRAEGFSVSDRVSFSAGGSEYCSRLLIGADGHSSKAAGLLDNRPREYIRGIQAVVDRPMEQDMFRIRFGSRYAPGFFTWEIPCGDVTRVGLCTSWSAGPPSPYLGRLLSDLGLESRVIGRNCGKIPIGRNGGVSGDRVMLIGDAASQVKPISGGGIYPMMRAAPVLADVASSALKDDDLSARNLGRYDRGLKDIWSEIDRAYTLRRLFLRMDDDDMSRAGRYAARDDVRNVMDDLEIDHPADVLRSMARHPAALLSGVWTALRCVL